VNAVKRRKHAPVPAVDPRDFWAAMEAGFAGMQVVVPENHKQVIISDHRKIIFRDHPLNRFAFAVAQYCEGNGQKFYAYLARSLAFQRIQQSPRAQPWIRHGDQKMEWHRALIWAAAKAPLNDHDEFNDDVFFAEVAAVQQRYNLPPPRLT
jgi:hypothetical protein